MKSVNLNFLETSGPLQACKGTEIRVGNVFEKREMAQVFLLSASFRICSILIFDFIIALNRTNG